MPIEQSLYQPLDPDSRTIRLLHIFRSPHPTDGRIQCSLVTRSLNSSVKYQALSYTWGSPDNLNFQIWINGILVPVRQNLLRALRARRANYKSEDERAFAVGKASDVGSLIWVDALCIDQSNIIERCHQVNMMGDIFRDAEEVLAWLGSPDELELSDEKLDVRAESPQFIEVPAFNLVTRAMHIKRILDVVINGQEKGEVAFDEVDSTLIWDKRWGLKAHEKKDWLEDMIKDKENEEELTQLAEICHVEYWSRLWIMQEVCLGRRLLLLYGRHTMNWSSLRDFSQEVSRSSSPSQLDEFPSSMSRILNSRPWRILRVMEDGMKPQMHILFPTSATRTAEWFLGTSLETALHLSRDAFCHERRDKVFGILGLADDVDTGDIAVNYGISLFQLYINVMVFHRERVSREHARDITTSMVRFSQLLQNALFGPDFTKEAYQEMQSARISLPYRTAWDSRLDFVHINGQVIGGVAAVCDKLELVPLFLDEFAPRTQSPDIVDYILEDMKEKWEWNRCAFEYLLPEPRPDGDTCAHYALTLFSIDDRTLGIAPRGIRAGDLLWECSSPESFWVVIRSVGRMFQPVGRAFMCEVLDDGGVATLRHPSRQALSKRSEGVGNLTLSIDKFQVLTLPLR